METADIIHDLVIYILIPGLIAAGIIYGVVRRKRAMASAISDDVCVSCDSQDVTMLGEGAYRCNACGYEGGSGMATMRDQAKHDAIEAMDPVRRREDAVRQLQSARGLLKNALTALEPALSSAPAAGLITGSQERQQDLAQCVNWFRQAQTDIQAAIQLLGRADDVGFDSIVNLNAPVFTFDPMVDNIIANVTTQSKLRQAFEQGQAMLRGVDRLLESAQGG